MIGVTLCLRNQKKRPVLAMMIPGVRQRVMIDGRDEVFLVVYVDRTRGMADLIPIANEGGLEEDVPLAKLQRVRFDSR